METTGAATTYYVYGHDMLYSIDATGPHYQHTDSLGSVVAITDASGAVEQTYDYDVFGVMRAATGTSGNNYTFTGEENDASGLVYLRARFYDPTVGRFLSRDPAPMRAGDTQTANRYVYARNNPTNYVDPSGRFFGVDDAIVIFWLTIAAPVLANIAADDPVIFPAFEGPAEGELLGVGARIESGNLAPALESAGQQVVRSAASNASDTMRNVTVGAHSVDEALSIGEQWLGPQYQEVGNAGSGVFRSLQDASKFFRVTQSCIQGTHTGCNGVAHVVLEYVVNGVPIEKIHIPIK
jgi:RHS repeat-associated protein